MHIFNNKVFTMVIGSPGSGKSTFAAKLVELANKAGVPAFCNYPVKGALRLDMSEFLNVDFGESVIILDEAGLQFNSRDFKTFTADHYHKFATLRHYGTQCFLIVQNYSRLDIALRELSTEVLYVEKSFFGLSKVITYAARTVPIEDREGQATEFGNIFDNILRKWFWRPYYYHMFDSYHKDREYAAAQRVLYDDSLFPPKRPLWKLIFNIRDKLPPPAASAPDAAADEVEVYDEGLTA